MSNFSGLIKKANAMQSFAALLGIGLAVISTVFTVKLMITFGTSGADKVIYAAFGALIQSAQTALFVYAAYAYWVLKDTGKAVPGFMIFTLLFFLSLAGSIGSFVVSNRSQNVQVEKNERIKSTYDEELSSIEKESDSVNKQLEGLKSKGVVTKAKGTEDKAAAIAEKRSVLFEGKRHVIASESTDDPDALYKILGEFFGITPISAKMLLFTLYAVALELASVILLAYSMVMFGSDVSVQAMVRQDRQREAGFVSPSAPAPAMARYREADEAEYDDAPPVPPKKKNIGFVVEKPEPVRSQSQSEFPSKDDVLDQMQRQLAELMVRDKALSEAARPPIPPASSKEEALADKILGSLPTGTSPVTSTSTGSDTSTGISTGIKQKPVSVPDEDEDGMDIDVIMQDYIEALFPTKLDGSLSGRALVCKRIGITEDVGRLVHQRLKKSGCIRVDGSKTFPECAKDEMIERMAI